MERILIPCPFDDDVLNAAKVYGTNAFKGSKKTRGHTGIRAQIAACKSMTLLVGSPIIFDDCLKRLKMNQYGKIDSVGMDLKDTVLKFGTVDDAVKRMNLQVSNPIVEAEMYVQTLTSPDEKMCFIAGWLYRRDVVRLGKDFGDYTQVPLLETYEPEELILVLKNRYAL
jgi:hypothetical protein